jgi:hypothetical protein
MARLASGHRSVHQAATFADSPTLEALPLPGFGYCGVEGLLDPGQNPRGSAQVADGVTDSDALLLESPDSQVVHI